MSEVKSANENINRVLERYRAKLNWIGAQSEKISEIKRIVSGRCPDSEKRFAVEGIWAHDKLLQAGLGVESLLLCPDYIYSDEAVRLVETWVERTEEVYIVSSKIFQKLSDRDEPDGLLSVGRLPIREPRQLQLPKDAVIVVLDGLENPGNIGTILRTCDGAGVDAVFVCNPRARMTNPKLIKGSMGAVFVVPIVEFGDAGACLTWLRERNFAVYLADTRANKTYKDYDYRGNTALVVGCERYGVSENWYDGESRMLSIPMRGVCDSLNVGTAASVCVYEICMGKAVRKSHIVLDFNQE